MSLKPNQTSHFGSSVAILAQVFFPGPAMGVRLPPGSCAVGFRPPPPPLAVRRLLMVTYELSLAADRSIWPLSALFYDDLCSCLRVRSGGV